MSDKKPLPLMSKRETRLCPVCGKPSYSKDGIHPQCAVAQADAPRRERLVEQKRRLASEKKKVIVAKSASKKCPACWQVVPVGTNLCGCGHRFIH